MASFASVILEADTRGLDRAGVALDRLADKGDKAGRDLTRATGGMEKGFQRVGTEAGRASAQITRIGAASAGAGRGIQQAAFQIGDFAVQVGAGTRASTALAQQLPQLLGGFGVFGAVAGAAVAILVPLASRFLFAGEKAVDAGESIDEAAAAADRFRKAADATLLSNADLAESYGKLAGAARGYLDAVAASEQANAIEKTSDGIKALVAQFGDLGGVAEGELSRLLAKQEELTAAGDQTSLTFKEANDRIVALALQLSDVSQTFGLVLSDAERLAVAIQGAASAEGFDAQAAAAENVRQVMLSIYGGVENITGEAKRFYDTLLDARGATLNVAAGIDTITAATSAAANEAGRLLSIYGEYAKARAATPDPSTVLSNDEYQQAAFYQQYATSRLAAPNAPPAVVSTRARGGASPAMKAASEAQREAQQVFEATRTAAEKYGSEVEKLNKLLGKGLITQDTYSRAVIAAQDALDDATDKAGEFTDAVESGIDGLADLFADFATGGLDGFRGLVTGAKSLFTGLLRDMVAQAAKADIAGILSGKGAKGIGGLLGGLGGSFKAIPQIFSGGGLGALGAAAPALGIIGAGVSLIAGLFKKQPSITQNDYRAVLAALDGAGQQIVATGKLSQFLARDLKDAAGGVDALASATQAFSTNFVTDAERRTDAQTRVDAVFAKVGQAVPESAKAYADLVKSIQITDRTSAELYGTLISAAPAFATLYGSINDTTGAVDSLNDALSGNGGFYATLFDARRAAAGVEPVAYQTGAGFTVRADNSALVEAVNTGNAAIAKLAARQLSIFQEWQAIGLPATATA